MKLISGAAGAFILLASGACAVPVTFDLTGAPGEAASMAYAVDGLSLAVTARSVDESGAVRPERDGLVTTGASGIGVRNRVGTGDDEKNVHVDGKSQRGFDDLLVFEFGARITSAVVTFVEGAGYESSSFVRYAPTVDGLVAATGEIDIDGPFSFALDAALFGLAARGDEDQYFVSSLTVDAAPTPVPVPAAGGLMALGLAGLGLLRRR